MPCLSFNRKTGKERGFALGLLVGLADMSLYSLGPMNLTVLPEPEGRAALSSSYQILLTPSTRTADAAADGSLIFLSSSGMALSREAGNRVARSCVPGLGFR